MKKQIMLIAFAAIAINAFSQNVIRGEYFIDSDPGFGSATGFLIAIPDSDFTQAITIPYASFPGPGYHNVFLRTLDSNGSWSHTSRSFVEVDENSNLAEVIKVEYFFNKDYGFGNNSFVMIDASPDGTWNFNIPFDQLPSEWKANDTLSIRVQEGTNNNWSQTTLIDSINLILVGINELEEISGVSVFPNPFTDEINVSFKNEGNLRIVLYRDNGQLILDKQLEKSGLINSQFLTPGVYIVVIYSDNQKLYGTKIAKY
jgi:hypothetical protein